MNIYKKALYDKYFVTPETIKKALNDSDWMIKINAMKEPNASLGNIYQALEDWNPFVRKAALVHPKANYAVDLYVLFADSDWMLKRIALNKIIMRLINFYH